MPDMWMDVDTNVVVPMNLLPITDDTDFKTTETGVVYNTNGQVVVWNLVTTAGVQTQTIIHPTTSGVHDVANLGNGIYSIEIPASGGNHANNDAEGFGWITGVATGMLPWRGPTIGFRAAALNNALIDGGDMLDVNMAEYLGTAAHAATVAGLPVVQLHNSAGTGGINAPANFEDLAIVDSTGLVSIVANQSVNVAQWGGNNVAAGVSGIPVVDLTYIHGSVLSESVSGYLAGGFAHFFDVSTPNSSMKSLPDAVAGARGGLPLLDGDDGLTIVSATGSTVLVNVETKTGFTAAVSDKTGFSLAATGLDAITATTPTGVATTFPGKLVQLWHRFFGKATLTSTQLKTYADNGTTVLTTQTVSDDGTTETQGKAS
jgi:hypothetical protein